MELFVFSHARESGSPAGTGQNASGGRKGFKVSSRSVDSQIRSNECLLGQNTAPQQSDPGAQDPPFYLSATTPAYQEARVTGGPQGCACTRTPTDGKRRGGDPCLPSNRKERERDAQGTCLEKAGVKF